MSGISVRSSEVSRTPNPEIPDLYPEFPGKLKQKANDCSRHGGWRCERRTTGKKGRGKGGENGGTHHEPICAVDLGGGGPRKWIDEKGRSSDGAHMEVDGGGPIPAGKSSSEAHGGVEKVRGVVGRALMEGIDERQPEMAGAPA